MTNTGDRFGSEVVQLYARVNAAVVTQPMQKLAGFARVELEPGASATVTFRLSADQFAFSGLDHQVAVEANRIDLFVGTSSDDHRCEGSLQVVGERRILTPSERTFLPTVAVAMSQS